MENEKTMRKQYEYKNMKEKFREIRNLCFKLGGMLEPPCFLCGYNGEGYFNPEKHPCVEFHHRFYKEKQND